MATERSRNLASDKDTREKLQKLYGEIEKGYQHQTSRTSDQKSFWEMYRCNLGSEQLFYGRNQLYAPLVFDAVTARSTRFTNQLFPQNGRHIDCVSADGAMPRAAISVAEHHIDAARLRELAPAMFVAGDCEGQYNVYTEWKETKRYTTRRTKIGVEAAPGIAAGDVDDVETEETCDAGPMSELIPDADICILPAVSATCDDAIACGGSVTIIRRWNKYKIKEKIKNKDIDKKMGEALLEDMNKKDEGSYQDMDKVAINAAGIKKDGRGDWALVYETWTELETPEGKRLCQVFLAGSDKCLMARRNPLWCDKLPLLSVPVKRQPGSAKGISPIAQVASLQLYANDVLNEVADATNYALLPILKRDPEAATAPLVLSPGAIWDVAPAQVESLQFPPVWEQGFTILSEIQTKIMQTLSVSPAMMTEAPSRTKKNQAEIAQAQQVEMLTTADAVRVAEEGIFTPLVQLYMDLDYQYRETKLLVQKYGEMGKLASTEMAPPLQNGGNLQYRWIGVEASRSAQMIQQKIAMMNMIRGIPPQAYPNYTFNAEPIMLDLVESTCGAQQGRQVFIDMRSQMGVDPQAEDGIMDLGMVTPVHPMDNDMEHMQAHKQSIEQEGDLFGLKVIHMKQHEQAAMQKMQAQKQAMDPNGGQQPGAPNSPQPGAQPMAPQGAQNPPGMIQPDQIRDPNMMPRRAG